MAPSRICSIENCGKQLYARGWCQIHYQRWYRGRDLAKGHASQGAHASFIKDIALPFDGDDCLPWPYCRSSMGYAITDRRGHGTDSVPRILCIAVNGKPPTPKHQAAHNCGKGHKGCVNPRHLRWATPQENQIDRIKHGTHNRGTRQGRSKLTEADVRAIRSMAGEASHASIAAKFGVGESNIRSILKRINWGWLS